MSTEAQIQLPQKWATPRVLEWARLRMGLGPDEVESFVRIPGERIIAWEQGKGGPTLAELEDLAEVYDCPVGYFFLDAPPKAEPSLDFRGLAAGKPDTLSYQTRLSLGEFLRLTDYVGFLVEVTGSSREPDIDIVDLEEPVESVAEKERKRFGFTAEMRQEWTSFEEAFAYWKGAVEARGVFVISLKLKPSEVRGASIWRPLHPPAILVNRTDIEAATGRTFTLLHEWAHLLVKHPGLVCDFRGQPEHDRLERFSNRFAAEVLVPRRQFEYFLKKEGLFYRRQRWGDAVLDRIRRSFKVSRDVVAVLLEEMQLAPAGFYRTKRATWDMRRPFYRGGGGTGRGQTKVVRRLGEIGLPLAKLVSAAYQHGAVSKLELAELLNTKVEQAERFVLWVQEQAGNQTAR